MSGPELSLSDAVTSVLRLIDERRAVIARPCILIAIDGPGGSGKSTLAAAIRQRVPGATVVQVDDFYRPLSNALHRKLAPAIAYDRYFDWKRLRDQVIQPLSEGHAARYRRHDWATDSLAEWHTVMPQGTVIIEGVYSVRPELRDYFDIALVVETGREECLRRLRRRKEAGDWIDHWRAAEDWYIAEFNPAERADLVISGSTEAIHDR